MEKCSWSKPKYTGIYPKILFYLCKNHKLGSSAMVMEEYSYTSTHPLGHKQACNKNTLPLPLPLL